MKQKMNRIYSLLGLAMKAGKIVTGEDAVRDSIKHSKTKLLIIATDASDNTKKRFINSATFYNTEYFVFGEKEPLSRMIGKTDRAVVAVNDAGFASSIKKMIVDLNAVDGSNNPGGELHE